MKVLEIFARLAGYLPDAVAEWLAGLVGSLAWHLMPSRRAVACQNIKIAVDHGLTVPLGIEQTARESFRHTAMTVVEFLRGFRHPWAKNTVVEGRANIDAALAGRRGVYLLVAHHGNWEACGASFSRLVAPAHILVKKVGSPSVNEFVLRLRRANGFLDISRVRKGDGVRAILKALGAGEMVAFVMDQSRPGEPKIPFFGVPAKSNTGLAAIWLRHPAPVVPAWIERLSFGRHRLHFLPPLDLSEFGTRCDVPNAPGKIKATGQETIVELTRIFNRTIENLIRQKPEQYFWLHRRWK